MPDYPDGTLPITISGIVIDVLPVDITAQTIGNIAIDIAGQSLGDIDINLAASDITLNIKTASGEHVDSDIISSITLDIDIVAQTVGNIAIDIAAQTMGNVDVNIAASAVTLNVDITAQSVGNISIDIAAQTVGNIDINLAASAISLNIKTDTGEHVDTDIVSSITLNVDITAQTVGNISIDIAAQTVGNIDVDIAAQTVDLNIKTSGGVNIIIDKLTQTAYTQRADTIANDNGVSTPTAPPSSLTADDWEGKFFPRGMRGMLRGLYLYCKRTGAGTVTLAYSPHPCMGEFGTVTITPGSSWDWKEGTPDIMWNYDSLFIWIKAISADVSYGYDTTAPVDAWTSADSGATWQPLARRYYMRAYISGLTIGDVPVSGTLNVVPIPTVTDTRFNSTKALPTVNTPVSVKIINGAGELEYVRFDITAHADSHQTDISVYCDDQLVWYEAPDYLNACGYTASSPQVSLLSYAVDGRCVIHVGIKFSFRRKFEIRATAIATGDQEIFAEGVVNLTK